MRCQYHNMLISVYEQYPCRIAGRVPRGDSPGQLQLDEIFSKAEQKDLSLGTCYALVAAQEGLQQAQWFPTSEQDRQNTGG